MLTNPYTEFVYEWDRFGAFSTYGVDIMVDGPRLIIASNNDDLEPIIMKPSGLSLVMRAPDYPVLLIHGPCNVSISLRIIHDVTDKIKEHLRRLNTLMSASEVCNYANALLADTDYRAVVNTGKNVSYVTIEHGKSLFKAHIVDIWRDKDGNFGLESITGETIVIKLSTD